MTEEWRPVPGFEANYQVSDKGRVRSTPGGTGRNRDHGRVRVQTLTGGYPCLTLTDRSGKRAFVKVHRLVCEAFHGPAPEGKPFALHGDGDKQNNAASNLRWGDARDNALDAVGHGTHPESRKTHCPRGHEYSDDNTVLQGKLRNKRECRKCRKSRNRDLPPGDPRHGRRATYVTGCRCPQCRAANAEHSRLRAQKGSQ